MSPLQYQVAKDRREKLRQIRLEHRERGEKIAFALKREEEAIARRLVRVEKWVDELNALADPLPASPRPEPAQCTAPELQSVLSLGQCESRTFSSEEVVRLPAAGCSNTGAGS